jgi:hypothetical protein
MGRWDLFIVAQTAVSASHYHDSVRFETKSTPMKAKAIIKFEDVIYEH